MSFSREVGFLNQIVGGGGQLVIDNIHSQNYVAGVSGWSINRDGSAEFSDVDVRGSLLAKNGNRELEIRVDDSGPYDGFPLIRWNPDISNSGDGVALSTDDEFTHQKSLIIAAPYPSSGSLANAPQIILYSDIAALTSGAQATISSPRDIGLEAGNDVNITSQNNINLSGALWSDQVQRFTFNPAWTAASGTTTLGNGTLTGLYWRLGMVYFSIRFVWGTTTTQSVGGAGWRFSLPVSPAVLPSTHFNQVFLKSTDVSTGGRLVGNGVVNAGSALIDSIYSHNTTAELSSTTPFAPANGDVYLLYGWYQPS